MRTRRQSRTRAVARRFFDLSIPNGKLEDEDEAWIRDFDARAAREKAARERFGAVLKRALASKGALRAPNQYPDGGYLIVHRSTRPGVAFQVSHFDRRGPVGHMDAGSLEKAVKYAWEDLSRTEKAKYRT